MAESTHILVPIPPLNLCAMCDDPGTQSCSRCNSIRYCSRECQKVDFSLHKLLCKSINDFKNTPTPHHFRSIYIPETQGDRIKFFWIPVIVDSILDQSQPFKGVFQSNPVLRRPIPYIFCQYTGGKAVRTGDRRNSNIAAIDPELSETTNGPRLYSAGGPRAVGAHRHLDMTDFINIVDHLRRKYYKARDSNPDWYRKIGDDVECVRLSCQGDEVLGHQPGYKEFVYPKTGLLRGHTRLVVPVFRLLGLPLVLIRLDAAPVWRGRMLDRIPAESNFDLEELNPFAASMDSGTMILMRSDGKPLYTSHAAAIVSYCMSIIDDVERDGPPAESISDERQAQLDIASMKKRDRHLLEHASEEGFRHNWEHGTLTPPGIRIKDLGETSPFDI